MASLTEEDQNQLHTDLPPLPGHRDHNCTDLTCLVLLAVAIGVQCWIGTFALEHGFLPKLSRGYDWKGRLCGIETEGKYLFHCMKSDGVFAWDNPLCVTECPISGNTTHECYSHDTESMTEHLDYDTEQVLNYCVPSNPAQLQQFLQAKIGNQTDAVSQLQETVVHAMSLVKRGWLPLAVAANIAIVVGYTYLLALDKTALPLVYACEFTLTVGCWLAGGYLIWVAVFDGGSDGVKGSGDSLWDALMGFLLLAFGCLALLMSICVNRSLPTAVGVIEATCECMFQEPTLLLEPFLSLIVKAVIIVFYAFLIMSLASTGQLDIPTGHKHDGFSRKIVFTHELEAYLAFTFVMFAWSLEMNHALSQYCLAWTTQMWYFTPYVDGVKMDKKPCIIFRAYYNGILYHFGTLAMGAFLQMFVRLPRWLIKPVAKAAKGRTNPVGKAAATLCKCCVAWYWSFLARIKKFAYMDVAITSADYMVASGRAMDIIQNEVPEINVLNGTQVVFQMALLGLTTYTGFLVSLVLTRHVPIFSSKHSPYFIEDPKLVAAMGAVLCGLIGVNFTLVFDTVGDTILYCFATEQRRHRNIDHEKYGKEKDESYWTWLTGDAHEEDDKDEAHVQYAPSRLRNLIYGQGVSDSDAS